MNPKHSIAIIIILMTIGMGYLILQSKPEARKKRGGPKGPLGVEVQELQSKDYTVKLKSYGTVQAYQKTKIQSEGGGLVKWISGNARVGTAVEKGEKLIELEKVDLISELRRSQSQVALYKQTLLEQQALADQALRNWKRTHSKEKASDLVLRKPQLETAQANLAYAQALVRQSQKNLERATMTAPYAGILTQRLVDLGEKLNPGQHSFSIISTGRSEIRVPLTQRQMTMLELPLLKPLKVTLSAGEDQWDAQLVRIEGEIDRQSRQSFGIVEINQPYQRKVPLRNGRFVEVEIEAKVLKKITLLPRQWVKKNSFVYAVDSKSTLTRQVLTILWQNEEFVVIPFKSWPAELKLVISPIGLNVEGSTVKVLKGSGLKGQSNPIEQNP